MDSVLDADFQNLNYWNAKFVFTHLCNNSIQWRINSLLVFVEKTKAFGKEGLRCLLATLRRSLRIILRYLLLCSHQKSASSQTMSMKLLEPRFKRTWLPARLSSASSKSHPRNWLRIRLLSTFRMWSRYYWHYRGATSQHGGFGHSLEEQYSPDWLWKNHWQRRKQAYCFRQIRRNGRRYRFSQGLWRVHHANGHQHPFSPL